MMKIYTAESFIEKAATESRMSGKSYEVKCEGEPMLLSSIFFNSVLCEYRKIKVTKG